ncbi:hypothetical protein PENVUL_c049G04873 [Penicillium vulpinum]|uniref:Uncharacterized protein n=2 Tax=Penicillium vulpinum TaxID=29845 RepID=A0A1V6RGJ1_9EURO|nr:hypothetical protein PENVUL_c049G04873 [Penicillium vulpinum]
MRFVQQQLPAVVVPQVYAYEGPGSSLAIDAGASYMLLESFYGNTLQDTAFDICSSIPSITEAGEPVTEKLSIAASEGLVPPGPFFDTSE